MSRVRAAVRLAVELPLPARDVLEALRVTHDNEGQAVTVCEIAVATAESVVYAASVLRGLNSINGERCELGPTNPRGFCDSCGRRMAVSS